MPGMSADTTFVPPAGIPELPPDATPDQKDEHWYRYVYQGDKMPQLTVRAVLMGAVIGMAMSIAHIYTSLKIGWGFGIAITACVISYVSWNAIRGLTGGRLSKMSILENNCMQSTASAAGYSTGSTVATAVGAWLLISGEHLPWPALGAFVLFAAGLGVFWAIPMKRQMINVEQLPFPSGIAAAETLKSLYSAGKESAHKAYALVAALGAGLLIGLAKAHTPKGLLPFIDKLHEWRFSLPDYIPFKDRWLGVDEGKKLINFGFDPSALLIAAGMIVGPRVSYSMLLGSILLYFFVGPRLIAMDNADAAAAAAAGANYIRHIDITGGGSTYHLIRWALWGGTALLVMSSLTSLTLQWKTIARSFTLFKKNEGPAPAHAQIEVPFKWLVIGATPMAIGLILTLYFAFQVEIWLGLIAVALSFVVALVCCRVTGETDTTPTGAMGKVTQAAFAVLSPPSATSLALSIKHNLLSAGATSNVGLAAADLLTDLKSGYLLGANPRKQFWAQFIGIFFGTVITVPAWYLMVPDKAALEAFNPPATNIWKAVAEALTEGIHRIPITARYAIVIGALLGIVLPVLEKLFPKAKKFMPSATGLGFAWVVVWTNAFSFAIGATIAWAWSLAHKKSEDKFRVPIASGLIAGESLMAAIIAILATAVSMYAEYKAKGGPG